MLCKVSFSKPSRCFCWVSSLSHCPPDTSPVLAFWAPLGRPHVRKAANLAPRQRIPREFMLQPIGPGARKTQVSSFFVKHMLLVVIVHDMLVNYTPKEAVADGKLFEASSTLFDSVLEVVSLLRYCPMLPDVNITASPFAVFLPCSQEAWPSHLTASLGSQTSLCAMPRSAPCPSARQAGEKGELSSRRLEVSPDSGDECNVRQWSS